MTPRYDAVQRFFLGYVYPDAHLDLESQLRVASDLLSTGDATLIGQVIADIRELIQEPGSDHQLHETIYEEYSQFHEPSPYSMPLRAWLKGCSRSLTANAAANRGRLVPWEGGKRPELRATVVGGRWRAPRHA